VKKLTIFQRFSVLKRESLGKITKKLPISGKKFVYFDDGFLLDFFSKM
jgi:hypothetical protein